MKICDYTQTELDYLQVVCNFTDEENTLFLLRSKDIPLEECAERMNISVPTVKRISQRVKKKIEREL
ncbi:MAG: sigma-70 family RNA polymerase sigma factor [Oscillospiraceae bacterium]|nr:sigma-70 family RNA polymerase sigma factor [Oscillospiraceae bacterium]